LPAQNIVLEPEHVCLIRKYDRKVNYESAGINRAKALAATAQMRRPASSPTKRAACEKRTYEGMGSVIDEA